MFLLLVGFCGEIWFGISLEKGKLVGVVWGLNFNGGEYSFFFREYYCFDSGIWLDFWFVVF